MTTHWKMGSCAPNPRTDPHASLCPPGRQSLCQPCLFVSQRCFLLPVLLTMTPWPALLLPRRVFSAWLMFKLKAIPWAATSPLGLGLGFHRFVSQLDNRNHSKFASYSGTFLSPRVFCRVLFTSHSYYSVLFSSLQFSSVAQLCPTLCDPMNRSTPSLPVHHQPSEFTQTHAHRVGDAIQPSHPLSSPSPPVPNPSQHQGLFKWLNSSHEVAKVLEFQLQHQSFQWTPRTDLL